MLRWAAVFTMLAWIFALASLDNTVEGAGVMTEVLTGVFAILAAIQVVAALARREGSFGSRRT
jgi:hypothetical protein